MSKSISISILVVAGILVLGAIYLKTSKPPGTNTSIFKARPDAANVGSDGKVELKSQGKAPEFTGIANWLNSDPLTMQQLRGKVVLIDFWTYSCINCVRTLPYVTKWYNTYKDQGFVVVGVHTPEFAFEKETKNVETAISRHTIRYPVAQDNDFATWNAYNNSYWPAHYLIDQQGNIVYTHFGEGKYDETENAIRQLLGMDGGVTVASEQRMDVRTPEIYFGLSRLEAITKDQRITTVGEATYTLPKTLAANTFALEGVWNVDSEKATLTKAGGKIRLNFHAGKVHMVAQSSKLNTLKIYIDGNYAADVMVSGSDLYTLFDSTDYRDHILEIQIPDSGFEAFTFTFG